jgi:hypothetical protein
VRRLPAGHRRAQVETSEGMRELPVPALPDLNTMITHQPAADDLLSHLLVSGIGTSDTTQCQPDTESYRYTGIPPVSGTTSTPDTGITDDEIRRLIAAGQSKNQVAARIPGAKQERLRRIHQALAAADTPPGAFRFLSDENEGGDHV